MRVSSRMGSSMDRGYKSMAMGIPITVSSSMAYLKDLGSMTGMMDHASEATSSKAWGTAMDCGKQGNHASKAIKDTMLWTRRMVMAFIPGKMDGSLREILKTTVDMDTDSCTTTIKWWSIAAFGRMAKKSKKRSPQRQEQGTVFPTRVCKLQGKIQGYCHLNRVYPSTANPQEPTSFRNRSQWISRKNSRWEGIHHQRRKSNGWIEVVNSRQPQVVWARPIVEPRLGVPARLSRICLCRCVWVDRLYELILLAIL